MATTTATITLSSTDLLSDELALTTSATLTGHNNSTGVLAAIGLSRITISDTSETTLFDASAYTDDKAHKIYIKNTETTASKSFLVKVGGTELGTLYAGDFMFAPWNADTTGTDCDVTITPSDSGMTAEYMAFID
tara:strand:- start:1043 stop:1447 length:405 start_codon:yes stop_codon:yes gene_type:complete